MKFNLDWVIGAVMVHLGYFFQEITCLKKFYIEYTPNINTMLIRLSILTVN
jgi:hypothetical protein